MMRHLGLILFCALYTSHLLLLLNAINLCSQPTKLLKYIDMLYWLRTNIIYFLLSSFSIAIIRAKCSN